MPIYIEDGFTVTKTIPARPGFHPGVKIVYRPALAKERHGYRAKLGADTIDAFENDLILRHAVSLNDEAIEKGKVSRLHPEIKGELVNLILSVEPPDLSPEELQGN